VDFFSSQDFARKRTKWLVGLFALAVILIIVTVYLLVSVLLFGAGMKAGVGNARLFDPAVFLGVAAVTIVVISLGSLYKISELRSGGEAVARMLGARPVDANTRVASERRLLNVVEEMALASGIPVPAVYVMQGEMGINAFAAGFGTRDAVVTVTEGTLRVLSRDELQGVIGHEFSHILNGDMRLNIRLMGVLHGILLIALIGYFLMRSGGRGRKSSGQIVILGLALYILGYVGIFFGRVIKAAVSRQREFLADASSVQFTRNPGGIAGALKKIGGLSYGSRLNAENAEAASHLFFGNALKAGFLGLTATHPPLAERIKRIDPSFDGTFPVVEMPEAEAPAAGPKDGAEPAASARPGARPVAAVVTAGLAGAALDPGRVARRVGTLSKDHLDYAGDLVARFPEGLREMAREPTGAQAIVYALLLDRSEEVREAQTGMMERALDRFLVQETMRAAALAAKVPAEGRLPLVDLTVPALRRMAAGQFQAMLEVVRELTGADRKVDLFEYTLAHVLIRHVAPAFSASQPPGVRYHSLSSLAGPCSALLSTLARHGGQDEAGASEAFRAGAGRLGPAASKLVFLPAGKLSLKDLDDALRELSSASPPLRKKLVEAAAACVTHDRKVTLEEGELLRAVSDALDCPSPPFIPGQEI